MLNRVTIEGRLGDDPVIRRTGTGIPVCNFSIAVSQDVPNAEPDWVRVTAWDKKAESASRFLHKGSRVIVDGKLKTKTTEYDGKKITSLEVFAQSLYFVEYDSEEIQKKTEGDKKKGNKKHRIDDDELLF